MLNLIKKWWCKLKNDLRNLYIDEVIEKESEISEDDQKEFDLLNYIKEKFKCLKKNNKAIDQIKKDQKRYLNREQAIEIALIEKNLKKHMCRDAINNGFVYGIIELKDFYSTLVKYNGNLAWYIKVLNGKYGLKDNGKMKKGYFDEYSNIRCLVLATTGQFIYIDDNFDTRRIKMITDYEFLEVILKFRK